MPIPKSVKALVARFDEQKDTYKATYNETQVRRDFIDPFFKALGWDMDNTQDHAEAYRDVIHEDKILVGTTKKAPDYSFRIGGIRKFFVEAKKPSVPIKVDPTPAFQVRRYGWSANLPISIVTDFEEFAVYDTTVKPLETDPPSKARLFYCTYEEYADKWDEIASLFSKEAILRGAFDRFNAKKRKGTETVDTAFLEEIEKWRLALAKNIFKHNKNLNTRELNSVVQTLIDRIIFLRICEDRGIEPEDRLKSLLKGKGIYNSLVKQFKDADAKYNSGLFHFKEEKSRHTDVDTLSPGLHIDDAPLRDIIESLYYPNPYEFSVLPPDILGQVYERFLGKVITLDKKTVEIEEKPEVRKAGGVYYTPSYIVDYIVKHTVGELLKDATPSQAEKLSIVDPACGSGSFLIVAYQYLLDWHLNYYVKNKGKKGTKDKVYESDKGVWKLSIAERKRILLNNIYGVDIDSQAVEVTKLSLLLKVLEGESRDTVESQLSLFKERALPDLSDNIKCGNSLIGSDFYAQDNLPNLTEEDHLRLNVFDWEEAFPEVFKAGGFDAVIGNPPWGADIESYKEYYAKSYQHTTSEHKDSFKLFIERSILILARNGFFGFITPSSLFFQSRYIDARRLIRQHEVQKLWNVGDGVFSGGVTAPCSVFTLCKRKPHPEHVVQTIDTALEKGNFAKARTINAGLYKKVLQKHYTDTVEENFVGYYRPYGNKEVSMETVLDCKDCGIKHQRVGCGLKDKGNSDLVDRLYYQGAKPQMEGDKAYVTGSDMLTCGWYIDTTPKQFFRGNYKSILKSDEIVYFNQEIMSLNPKIVWRQTSDRLRAAILGGVWFSNTLQAGIPKNAIYDIHYYLGLLNSKFLNFCYIESVKEAGRTFPQVKMGKIKALPFRQIDFKDRDEVSLYLSVVKAAQTLSMLYQNLYIAVQDGNSNNKLLAEKQIKGVSASLNNHIYQLYGLTQDEIAAIESTIS